MKSLLLCSLFFCAFTVDAKEAISAKLHIDEISSNMQDVNPNFNLVSQGELLIGDSAVALTLTKKMPDCPMGMFCPQIMPGSIVIFLQLTEISHTECSTKYTAETPGDVNSPLYEKVIIEDYSNSTCERLIRAPGVITYIATQKDNTAAARFFVHDGFVRP